MLDDCSRVVDKMNRKKTLEEDLLKTPLNRCLTTFDLTLFGISQMVGAGIFVLTGTVIRDKAGPGGILSYLFAGVAAVLSALCYAEFGARVPKAGSAYTYTYIIIGEFWAFLVGWNIILEYLIGASAVARGLSGSFDALSNYKISNWTSKHIGTMPGEWLSDYPDFVSFFLVILVSCLVACTGAKKSVVVNSVFTIVNVVVIVFVAVLGFCYADPTVWEEGGFLPYGMGGVFGGAAACFYAFIGFDAISIAGEEAATPGRSIPIATMLSVVVCTVLYVFATMALTLLVPYDELSASAPFPVAFDIRGLKWAKIVVSIGTIIAMFTALLVDLFALPRTVYAISSDGLFFEAFSRINERTQTPVLSIMAFGFLAALLALFFSIDTLVEFLSIGTLLAYTIVAAAVIFIRYQPLSKCQFALKPDPTDDNLKEVETPEGARQPIKENGAYGDFGKLKAYFRTLPILRNCEPGQAASNATILMAALMAGWCSVLIYCTEDLGQGKWWAWLLCILLLVGVVLCFFVITAHVQNTAFLTFQIPLVPLLPAASMFVNIAMMLKLSYLTWIRLAVWIAVGLIIYFTYGIRHSAENRALSSYTQIIRYSGDATADDQVKGMVNALETQPVQDVKEDDDGRNATGTENAPGGENPSGEPGTTAPTDDSERTE